MSDLAYKYYNQLDTLDLSDLEILLDKINSLIFTKKEKIFYWSFPFSSSNFFK